MSTITSFRYPASLPRSGDYKLTINGVAVEVLAADGMAFANFVVHECGRPIEVAVRCPVWLDSSAAATLRPLSAGLRAAWEGDTLVFKMPAPGKVVLEIDNLPLLCLWANAPEENPPSPGDKGVQYFRAGQSYDVGLMEMSDHETLYIEGGAVVRGRLHVKGRTGVTVRGQGIFDGSFFSPHDGHMVPSLFFERCRDVLVRDITVIRPSGWMLVLGCCEGVRVENLKELGSAMCSDGVDIVGSRHVHIRDCFIRNNDDCFAIKALDLGPNNLTGTRADLRECPEDILVEDCIIGNGPCGSAMTIGHELDVDRVGEVTFRNIDVLFVHGTGGVFAIQNCGRASVENVLYENIRIEHCYEKFIDFRITCSHWADGEERGSVRGVVLRDVHWHQTKYNPGYTISVIGGWDPDHRIDDVLLENIRVNDKHLGSLDDLELYTRHTTGLLFAFPKKHTSLTYKNL